MANIVPVRLAYNTFEPNSGEDPNLSPVIYLHGATGFKEYWGDIPQTVADATKRRVYTIDARNHGDSEWSDYFNFDANVDDLIHFMDTVGISKAILVGHSMGGMTAIRTSLKWPGRIEKIVAEDTPVRKIPKEMLQMMNMQSNFSLQAVDAVPAELDEDSAKKFIVRHILTSLPPPMLQFMKEASNRDPEDTRYIAICRDENGRYRFKANIKVILKALEEADSPMSGTQGIFEGPALFIYGKLSPFSVGAEEHHIKQFFPNAVFEGIEKAGHDLHTDQPLEYMDALLKFLSPDIVPVRLAYNTFEPNSGEDRNLSPIIYIHGLTAFKEYWGDIPQIVANTTKRRAYAIDARNHGDSEWSDYFNFDVNADDLIHFMDTVGIKKAILVGHSMGGMASIKASLRWPDRIEKIVVEDMLVRRVSKEILQTVITYMELAWKAVEAVPAELDEESAKKFIVRHIFSNIPPQMIQLINEAKKKDIENTRFIAIRRDENGRYTFKANLKGILKAVKEPEGVMSEPEGIFEGPACFIYGKLSPFLVGADEHHIKQFFPNAVFEGIEEANHDVHTDKPLEFTDALLKFLSS